MSREFKKVSIIMPVYNEEAFVSEIIGRVLRANTLGLSREIIAVDDGSCDGTLSAARRLADGQTVRVFSLDRNMGKGCALRRGFQEAQGDIFLIQDADFEYDTAFYPVLLEPILSGKARVVYGSRFMGTCRNMRLPNRAVNIILRAMANGLYGLNLTDEATGFKVFTRDVLDGMNLVCKRFEFCPELTAKIGLKKIPIVEVPITYSARTIGEGKKIRWYDAFIAIWTLLKYRIGFHGEDLTQLKAQGTDHEKQ